METGYHFRFDVAEVLSSEGKTYFRYTEDAFQVLPNDRRKRGRKMKINTKNLTKYTTFDNLQNTGLVKHCFTTRHGGVSTDYGASINMGFARGEKREPVLQNYKILAEAVGLTAENYVTSQQTHTTNVRTSDGKPRRARVSGRSAGLRLHRTG
ncbi:MAG: laccase domain-containing protein [Anaerotignum faecicola]